MKKIIHVTDKHIDRGIGRDGAGCAIAVAAEEAIPQYEIFVGRITIVFMSLLNDSTFCAFHGLEITRFIDAFDRWKDGNGITPRPEPTCLEIEIPDQETQGNGHSDSCIDHNNAPELVGATKSREGVKARSTRYSTAAMA